MPRWRVWANDEDGSAAVEFITAGVILLVPFVYLIITLGGMQQSLLGVEAAARHTARVIGQAEDAPSAATRGDAVIASVIDEYQLEAERVQIAMHCVPSGIECPSTGATVVVTVSTRVSLPFVPAVFGLDEATSIPLEAVAAQKVSRLWGTQ
ncbi:TadE family protein [uncultured Microbacterium sp.]|uniref:TadE family protein n=1 Tax=uncultured Microbacterium sp. TaxID=191216 RepID=UPI002622208E|nr:TadE family protein [uncultured Microbacterium sp.]